jgi:hypothetical protein
VGLVSVTTFDDDDFQALLRARLFAPPSGYAALAAT